MNEMISMIFMSNFRAYRNDQIKEFFCASFVAKFAERQAQRAIEEKMRIQTKSIDHDFSINEAHNGRVNRYRSFCHQ